MIDITTITRQSLGKVVSYYADSADDYYSKDGTAMQWQGNGADSLGLEGEVQQERFRSLLDGRIDESTKIQRGSSGGAYKERLGYDLTFSAPKGVSLQALVHGDQAIVAAHDKAVAAAVREAEMLAMARTTENKKTSIENTNSLVVAKFRHETSRALDPDLHTHAFVLNMTQREDGQWRALTNDGIIQSAMHIGNVYKAELAKELELAGFMLRYERNGTFDLAHFSDHQIRQFSARSQQIEEALAAKGLDRMTATHAEKNQAALATRGKKDLSVDRDELRAVWRERSKALGIDFHSREWAGAGANHGNTTRNSVPTPQLDKPLEYHADKVLEFAVKSLTERQSIVGERELMQVALKHGFGRLSVDDVRAAMTRRVESGHLIQEQPLYVSRNPAERSKAVKDAPQLTKAEWVSELVKMGRSRSEAVRLVSEGIAKGRLESVEPRFTTHIAQRREREVLQIERMGRGSVTPRMTQEQAKAFIESKSLKPEQEKAVLRIVGSENQFSAVQGFAGVGKSYMTVAAKEALESSGLKVTGLAPYGSQVKALQGEGLEARTVQSFLKAKDKKIDADTVVFIDEAGVIPARQMHELMKTIQDSGARAVLLGDTEQTKAVEAGKPFEQLMKAGMETSYLTDIQRQKNPELLKAVQLAANGNSKDSLAHVTSILNEPKAGDRYAQMVKEYAALTPDQRERTLIVTGTNASRKALNEGVRQELGLKGQGTTYPLLNRLDTTQAERKHSKYYEKGAVIVPEQTYKNGLTRGKQYTILDTGPGNLLTVRSADGETLQFSPARYGKISVYSVEKTELAPGDRVRIQRNDAQLDVANGDHFKVKEVGRDTLVLEAKDRSITLDPKSSMFLSLAYATTAHSAQGLTCDKVMINLETTSRTTTKDVYYVAISRARHEALIYTDNYRSLDKAVSQINGKTAALEIKQLMRHAKNSAGIEGKNEAQHQAKELGNAGRALGRKDKGEGVGIGR